MNNADTLVTELFFGNGLALCCNLNFSKTSLDLLKNVARETRGAPRKLGLPLLNLSGSSLKWTWDSFQDLVAGFDATE